MNDESLDTVLAHARTGLAPSDAQLEAIGARLAALSVPQLPLSEPALPAPRAAGHWAAFKATGSAGLAVAGLLVAGGFLAGLLAQRMPARAELPPEPARATPAGAPLEVTPAPAAPSAAAPPAPAPSAAIKAGQAGAPRPRAAPSSRHDSAAELALLERIDRALRSSDAALARALLGELEARHPKTRFAEERSAARIMADCLAGDRGTPQAASRFLAAHPASVYASRLRALCQLDGQPTDGVGLDTDPG
jgi:hypothetical protein